MTCFEESKRREVAELYDAAVTVMMRLIFLFYAEETDLLPMSEPLYVERYATSSLRDRLQAVADEYGEEVLESTYDGWPRLLSAWRAVFGGVEHGDMVISPYGGSLFDPDRYPLLEGRQPESSWVDAPADPLPIDNRTVLHLLNALQTLDEGGHRRRLSFRALDVEQIGHVYEGMLDHTAARAEGWVLGLSGVGAREPEIEVKDLEFADDTSLIDFLSGETGRSAHTIEGWLRDDQVEQAIKAFGSSWASLFADPLVEKSVRRFARLVRPDSTGGPTAFPPGSAFVSDSSHRGATGTHYTPRSLTEEVVRRTLEPLVYVGPSDGQPQEEWVLRTPEEIVGLRICDPACGSGAFLVQSCRYLAEVLVAARRVHGSATGDATADELLNARRLVAERCLHGVDVNPMACEMAKLSLWILTMAEGRPFSFLDHGIRCGDSLVGVTAIEQLVRFRLAGAEGSTQDRQLRDVSDAIAGHLQATEAALSQLSSVPTHDIYSVGLKEGFLQRASESAEPLSDIADLLVDTLMRHAGTSANSVNSALLGAGSQAVRRLQDPEGARALVGVEASNPRPLHWPIEFPVVFGERGGFDAIVGNPPFLGGTMISTQLGARYRRYLSEQLAGFPSDRADLVSFFFARAAEVTAPTASVGLIATQSISSGSSREVGLAPLEAAGWQIIRAHSNKLWPGMANVRVAEVWLWRGGWQGASWLDGAQCAGISSWLEPSSRVRSDPVELPQAGFEAVQGIKPTGKGFILSAAEGAALINDDPFLVEVIRPYLTGSDLNSTANSAATRWIIDFRDWPEARCRKYERAFRIVEERVRPEREGRKKPLKVPFWQFEHTAMDLRERMTRFEEVLVVAYTSRTVAFQFVKTDQVLGDSLVVVDTDSRLLFGALQSEVHRVWVDRFCTKMKQDVRYSPVRVLRNYPLPAEDSEVVLVADEFEQARAATMERLGVGLTRVHSMLHNPDECPPDLHEAFSRLNRRVLDSYGWHDLPDVDWSSVHGETRLGFDLATRAELVDRLIELNLAHAGGQSTLELGRA